MKYPSDRTQPDPGDALAVVVLGIDGIHQDLATADQIIKYLVRQVRVDCGSTEAKQRKVMGSGPAGFDHNVGVATQAFLPRW